MKQEKINQILLVSCIFTLGLNGMTGWKGDTHQEIHQSEPIKVSDLSVAHLGSLSLKHEDLALGILMVGDEFEFISDADHDFGLSEIRSLVYSLCNIQSQQEFSDKTLWADFGYENPQSKLVLTSSSGEKLEYSLLKTMEDYGYLYDYQRDTVFLVDGLIGKLMLIDSHDLYQKSVFPVINGSNYQAVQEISLSYREEGRDYTLSQKEGSFYLEAPIYHKIPVVYALSQLVTQLSALYGDEVVEISADWADYGIYDSYDLKVTMMVADSPITAYFLPEEGDSFLLAREETGDIFRIYGDYYSIAKDYTNLLQGKVLQFAMGDIEKLVLTQGEKSLLLEISEDGSPLENDSLWSQESYQAFVSALNSLELVGETDSTPWNTGDFALDIYYRKGDREKILFSTPTEKGVAVSINGQSHFYTSERAINQLRSTLPA